MEPKKKNLKYVKIIPDGIIKMQPFTSDLDLPEGIYLFRTKTEMGFNYIRSKLKKNEKGRITTDIHNQKITHISKNFIK